MKRKHSKAINNTIKKLINSDQDKEPGKKKNIQKVENEFKSKISKKNNIDKNSFLIVNNEKVEELKDIINITKLIKNNGNYLLKK